MSRRVSIDSVRAQAFEIPTDKPEADGTISWNSTTLVLVEISGGGETGLGYTYSERFNRRVDRRETGRRD